MRCISSWNFDFAVMSRDLDVSVYAAFGCFISDIWAIASISTLVGGRNGWFWCSIGIAKRSLKPKSRLKGLGFVLFTMTNRLCGEESHGFLAKNGHVFWTVWSDDRPHCGCIWLRKSPRLDFFIMLIGLSVNVIHLEEKGGIFGCDPLPGGTYQIYWTNHQIIGPTCTNQGLIKRWIPSSAGQTISGIDD